MFKKILSVVLSTIVFLSCIGVAFAAQEDNIITGEMNVISFNVDGLPVPSFLSSSKRNALTATNLIAKQINAADCDILCAQEDFDFHSTLEKNLDMGYATHTSGGAGIGDGLNIFSKYPIYNVGRVEWNSAYGVFDCGSDELTPKGILYCTVEIADGVYVDVYTIHADAWEDDNSMLAKADEYDQLTALIEEHSGGDRAVILTGDFNSNYALFREGYANGLYNVDLCAKLTEDFNNHGFKDAWIEYNNDGNYDFTCEEMYNKYGCEYQRTWDTLDHVYYRSGAGVSLDLVRAVYDDFDTDEITWDGYLSDHAAVRTTFSYTINTDEVTAPDSLNTESISLTDYMIHVVKSISSLLFKAIINLPALIFGDEGFGWIK